MGEDLAVTVIADIARDTPAHEIFPDRDKRCILAVCHRRVTLDEKRVAGVEVYGIIRVLPSLRKDYLCLQR